VPLRVPVGGGEWVGIAAVSRVARVSPRGQGEGGQHARPIRRPNVVTPFLAIETFPSAVALGMGVRTCLLRSSQCGCRWWPHRMRRRIELATSVSHLGKSVDEHEGSGEGVVVRW